MEEFVGGLWHRFITRAAERSYPQATVRLADIEKTAGVLFRAFGGDAGLRVAASCATRHGARRRLLQRIAGSGDKAAYAAVDHETLRLPPEIGFFPEASLNRDLYLWLIALAATECAIEFRSPLTPSPSPDPSPPTPLPQGERGGISLLSPSGGEVGKEGRGRGELRGPAGENRMAWIVRNQQATLAALERYPGLRGRYLRLVEATIACRIDAENMPAAEAVQERAIHAALREPGSVTGWPDQAKRAPQPVPLWLYPSPAASADRQRKSTEPAVDAAGGGSWVEDESRKRYAAERVDTPDGKNGFLMMFRAESLFSWAEYIKVNRSLDDDPNPEAASAAEDLDKLSVTRDGTTTASRVRFDLDLPSAAEDDMPLGEGIPLPEWDYRKHELKRDWCRLQTLTARNAEPLALPPRLHKAAKRLRSQFAALQPARRWLKSQPDGAELDLDACVRAYADRMSGANGANSGIKSGANSGIETGSYLAQARRERDLACLALADLSLSTDAYVSDTQRVIDVIRDSLTLFAEALSVTGDRFGFYGFSSLKRGNIRFHRIKDFDERYDTIVRGRIAALKPGYYTRMGAAIRHGSSLLAQQPSALRLLLILSDGKPNDLDHYEGRYGIEDTRMSIIEARRLGLRPFCVTIDREGQAYLPHLFGPAGYTIIRRPEELPARLPLLYAQLTST